MRQFYAPLNTMLTKGLIPEPAVPSEGSFLSDCSNAKPMAGGLSAVPKYVRNIALGDAQAFVTTQGIVIATPTDIYTWTVGGGLVSVLAGAFGNGAWFIADFSRYIVLCNGTVTVKRAPDGTWSLEDNTVVPLATAICNAGGRAVIGGLPDAINWVKWSEIGAMKFLNSSDMDSLYKNTSGERQMEWEGQIHAVMALTSRAVVLGEGGVSILMPASVEPFAYGTMGLAEAHPVGVGSGFAVCTTKRGLFYVNLNNELCFLSISKEGAKVDVIGYSDYLSYDCQLSYDERLEELYIALQDKTYIFNKHGLGAISHPITGVFRYGNSDTLNVYSASAVVQNDMEFTSDEITLNYTGAKTAEDVLIAGKSLGTMYACVLYKNANGDSFIQAPWHQVNNLGYARIGITADQFKVKIKITNFTGNEVIKSVKLGFKTTDKRFTKGVTIYGNQNAAGSNQ